MQQLHEYFIRRRCQFFCHFCRKPATLHPLLQQGERGRHRRPLCTIYRHLRFQPKTTQQHQTLPRQTTRGTLLGIAGFRMSSPQHQTLPIPQFNAQKHPLLFRWQYTCLTSASQRRPERASVATGIMLTQPQLSRHHIQRQIHRRSIAPVHRRTEILLARPATVAEPCPSRRRQGRQFPHPQLHTRNRRLKTDRLFHTGKAYHSATTIVKLHFDDIYKGQGTKDNLEASCAQVFSPFEHCNFSFVHFTKCQFVGQ